MKAFYKTIDILDKTVHLYNSFENKKTNYGLDCKISIKEIHAIQFVGENPGTNLVSLSKYFGTTKSAGSQMVNRLIAKNYVIKNRSEHSAAEISLFLTDEGMTIYKAHNEFHQQGIFDMDEFASKYSDEEWERCGEMLLYIQAKLSE